MGGSIGRMNAPDSTPPRDLKTAIGELQDLAMNVAYTVSLAEYADAGSERRDELAADALGSLEQLESVIRDARKAIEALP